MAKFILAVCFFLASAGSAWAQGDDFPDLPPPYFVSPQPSPFPPFSNQGPYKWRTVGGSQTVGALRGWTVKFRIHMNWFPGALWLNPTASDGSEVRYTGGYFYHGDAGNWCIDECSFEVTAGSDYFQLYLDAYAPYRFIETNGAYIYVTEIIPTARKPRPAVDQLTKDKNGQYASWAGFAGGFATGAGIVFGAVPGGQALGGLWTGTGFLILSYVPHFQKVHDDGWDPDYWSFYPVEFNSYLTDGMGWVCPYVDENDNSPDRYYSYYCPYLRDALLTHEAHLRALAATLDRMQSCYDDGASCEDNQRGYAVSLFYDAASSAYQAANMLSALADGMRRDGWNTDDDAVGVLYGSADTLRDEAAVFNQVTWDSLQGG